MNNFGQNLRHYRQISRDPDRGGLLTQERLGELIGVELGDRGYSGAAISDWERGKSKIHQDDRLVLNAIIQVLYKSGGIKNEEDANALLLSGNYRPQDHSERSRIFQNKTGMFEKTTEKRDFRQSESDIVALEPAPIPISSKRRKQLILLEKVTSFWVEGVFEKSLNNAPMLQLEMINCNEFVDRPLAEQFGLQIQYARSESSDHILNIYLNADRALLILGEPGSGKTMTLILLAYKLSERALARSSEPVPVILNLSSWAKQKQSIADWVVEELTMKYQIPRHYGHEWLQNDELVLLMDGYDQLPIKYRIPISQAVNNFRESNGLTGLVICSRIEEYRQSVMRLRLSGAVEIQALDEDKIDNYLEALGPDGDQLQMAIKKNGSIQQMAQSPLLLGILRTVFEDKEDFQSPVPISKSHGVAKQKDEFEAEQNQMLFSTYVERMFRQLPFENGYRQDRAITMLSWLARQQLEHNQEVFLIEQLQPSWLPGRKWRWVYMLFSGLLLGLAGGFIIWLLWQLLRQTLPQLPAFTSARLAAAFNLSQNLSEALTILIGNILLGLAVAVLLGIIFEFRLSNERTAPSNEKQRRFQVTAAGVLTGLLTFLVISWSSGVFLALAWLVAESFMYMAAARYIFGWNYQHDVRTVEALGWSWRHALSGLGVGLGLAFLAEAIESLLYGYNGFARTLLTLAVAGFILGGLRGRQIREKSRPNQGVWLSIRNALLASIIVSLPIAVLNLFLRNPEYAFTIGLLSGIIAASILGISDVVKHFLLRMLLHWTVGIPWRFARFLDFAARLTFLRKVGGGYIFMHGLLQDYFANL